MSAQLPGIGHTRCEGEPGPIKIDEVEIAVRRSTSHPQFVQMCLGCLEISFIPLIARRTAHPFPDVTSSLEQPLERIGRERFAEFLRDLQYSGFQRTRIFQRQLQRLVFLASVSRMGGRPLRGSSESPSNPYSAHQSNHWLTASRSASKMVASWLSSKPFSLSRIAWALIRVRQLALVL